MKKKLLTSLLVVVMLFTLTACGGNSDGGTSKKAEKGNCTALECIKDLNDKSTVEDINKVVGFEGKLEDSKYNNYVWEIGENDSLSVLYYSEGSATIEAKYSNNDLKNSDIDFSKYSEIQSALKSSTSLTYDEFCEKVNGKGTLYYISSSTKKYVWVNKNGEYLTASFSTTSDKCTFVTGRISKTN